MSHQIRMSTRQHLRHWLTNGLYILVAYVCSITGLSAKEVKAYAKALEEYIYIYTLDHEYETTLFRSEMFEPLAETEDGFIISLQLGGKQKLVLLPFESRDRKVAEKKYRGVGVTYTAYLTFTEGHLPFTANQYYEVVKQEKGKLFIDYHLKGFSKVIEVPESRFQVKTAFEYHLEKSLDNIRQSYRNIEVPTAHPESWNLSKKVSKTGLIVEAPTHVAIAKQEIIATNYQSIRTASAKDFTVVLTKISVSGRELLIVPVVYTHKSAGSAQYFANIKGYNHPVLIKEFVSPEDTDAYSKAVRITSPTGIENRLLEITDNTSIEFYPDFRFLSPGSLASIRVGDNVHHLVDSSGEYKVSQQYLDLFTPKAFLGMWESETVRNRLSPEKKLYRELLEFDIPAVATFKDDEWKNLEILKELAQLNSETYSLEDKDAQTLAKATKSLESRAHQMGLSFQENPLRSKRPSLNRSYFSYWKHAFSEVNNQAAREGNKDVLRRQLLRAKILAGETEYQALLDFLSNQIYTYSNYLPGSINRINQLESDVPLGASDIMVFNYPLEESFKTDPATGESLHLSSPFLPQNPAFILKRKHYPSWLLNIGAIQFWQTSIIAKMEEVSNPAYWTALQEKEAANKLLRQEVARQKLTEAQLLKEQQQESLENAKLPWIASSLWLAVILTTNGGFFALSKVMPLRQS